MKRTDLLAYAQLMRLPNVFTLVADVSLGCCVLASQSIPWERQFLVFLCSIAFYLAGMVSNDYFDRHSDREYQAHRPIPSGRVPARSAFILMSCLFVLGYSAYTLAFPPATHGIAIWPVVLFTLIIAYNGGLKHTPLGPIAMGGCRFVHVLLVLSLGSVDTKLALHLAGVIGLYIVGITWFARSEDRGGATRQLIAATLVMLVALMLAGLVPMHLPAGSTPFYFLFLDAAFILYLASPILGAIADPSPKTVQNGVKRAILGLILLDAILAVLFVGPIGLLLALLMIPALRLGRWVYST